MANNGILNIDMIYTNDLDHGSYISDTLKIDSNSKSLEALVEIYRMMRPGEPLPKRLQKLYLKIYFS